MHQAIIIRTLNTGNTFSTVQPPKTGGMGRVLFARREKDGKIYALKTVRPELLNDNLLSRFREEAHIWIILGKHPHIVQAHWFDLVEYEGGIVPFLIMEYIPVSPRGTSLRDWLERQHSGDRAPYFPESQIIKLMNQTLAGLIHARNVIRADTGRKFSHCDLKPDNLLIGDDGRIKVSDFGLAQVYRVSNRGAGTPPYMPPEQWRGNAVPEKSDVYALGCIMYELFSGYPPFGQSMWLIARAAQLERLKQRHLEELPTSLEGASEGFNHLLSQCLQKDSDKRPGFESMQEKLAKLYRELTGRSLSIPETPAQLGDEDWNSRGSGFRMLGFPEKARFCFERALALNDREGRFHLNHGNALLQLGQVEEALAAFRNALHLDPALIEAHISSGSALAKSGHYQMALAAFDRAERLNRRCKPVDPVLQERIHLGRGMTHACQGIYDPAQQQFEIALGLNPNFVEAHFGMGNIYYAKRLYHLAVQHYQKALALNPDYRPAREMLNKLKH